MSYDIVLYGNIADPIEGLYEANIIIKNGIIDKITQEHSENRKIELPSTSLIFPGFIDPHVHLRQDASGTWNYKEDFITGSMAAAHGGLTTVADMPNNPVPAVTPEKVIEKINLSKKAIIDILFYGGVSGNLDKLKPMSKIVCGYKIYTQATTGVVALEPDTIEKAIRIIAETEKPVVFHSGENLREILSICENYPAKIHIAHVKDRKEISLIEKYKKRMHLTCEATPHHLYFSEQDKEKLGKLSIVNPPLMPEADRSALFNALKKGVIDMLATDHAPHTIEDKKKGAAGMPELDTYGSIVSWLIEKGINHQQIAQLTSYNAARLLGIQDRGSIKEGMTANLSVIDMKKSPVKKLYTKCQWSPFQGHEFPGSAICTIFNGRIIMNKGTVI